MKRYRGQHQMVSQNADGTTTVTIFEITAVSFEQEATFTDRHLYGAPTGRARLSIDANVLAHYITQTAPSGWGRKKRK